MPWLVRMADEFEEEFLLLDETVQDGILAGAELLKLHGPQLGRPHVDTLKGARHRNLKELRFEAADGVWRVAFAFDPARQGVLLIAGRQCAPRLQELDSDCRRTVCGTLEAACRGREKAPRPGEKELIAVGRTIDEIIASLPKKRQQRIEKRFQELSNEVETLRELREAAGKAQAHIAAALNIKQPSVSKIERQTDMYLSTLRSYVEAVGGELELTVRFPSRPPVRLRRLGEALDTPEPRQRERRFRSSRRRKPALEPA